MSQADLPGVTELLDALLRIESVNPSRSQS